MNIIDAIIQGILLGGLYALFATGLSLMFGIMRLVNLAHGDIIILGAFILLFFSQTLGLPIIPSIIISIPVMALFGYILQKHVLNRVMGGDVLPPLLITFGLSIIIQNILLLLFSADSQRLILGDLEVASIVFYKISIGVLPLLNFVCAILVIIILNYIFYNTSLGRALRAVSNDPRTAMLMGINTKHLFGIAMVIAIIVSVIAAFFLGVRANFDPSIGPARLLYAFEAVIIGGLGSLWGTLIGGMIIGVAQTIGAVINPEWQILSGHIVFLIIIIFKPRGLFPRVTH